MTTITVLFAMIPLALKLEEGAESRAPMAMVHDRRRDDSTLLTLVLVPVMYTYLDDLGRLPALARAPCPGDGASGACGGARSWLAAPTHRPTGNKGAPVPSVAAVGCKSPRRAGT